MQAHLDPSWIMNSVDDDLMVTFANADCDSMHSTKFAFRDYHSLACWLAAYA